MTHGEIVTKLKYDAFLLEEKKNYHYNIYKETDNTSDYREYEECVAKIAYIQELLEYAKNN